MEISSMRGSLGLEDDIAIALRRISRAIDLRSRVLLLEFGLTTPQLTALLAIARLQPVNAGALAKAVYLGQPTVTGILNRLERRGLIARIRSDQDRRAVQITVTEDGKRMLATAPALLDEQFQRRLLLLKDWERTQILSALQRVADMMDADSTTDEDYAALPGESAACVPDDAVSPGFSSILAADIEADDAAGDPR
jgi:DNA-binding MarR family transcriptional regulator